MTAYCIFVDRFMISIEYWNDAQLEVSNCLSLDYTIFLSPGIDWLKNSHLEKQFNFLHLLQKYYFFVLEIDCVMMMGVFDEMPL